MSSDRKKVFLTGGASGIGRATALRLAGDGADVYIADIDADGSRATAASIAERGGRATVIPLDVTDRAAIFACAARLATDVGAMDAIVGVAGWDISQPFLSNEAEFIERVVRINYLGQVYVAQALLPAMVRAGRGGRVVTVASDAGRVGSAGETVYAGAKGGVVAFTKSLAREMARHGITCNCVCPGPTDTPLFAAQPENLRHALVRAIPLRRLAEPDDIAHAIAFFLSDRSGYITGQVLSVSGGLTMNG